MKRYRLSPIAEDDLAAIGDFIAEQGGAVAADRAFDTVLAAFDRIADSPGIGHRREDVTSKSIRIWRVFDYLVIYRPETRPLEILRIWHGARVPSRIDDAIREADDT